MAVVRSEPSPIPLWTYLGCPVMVQLRNFPLIGVQVRFKDKLSYVQDKDVPAWIPEPLMSPRVDDKGNFVGADPEGTQLIQFAVLYEIEGQPDWLEMRWFSRPPDPRDKNDPVKKAVICTLIRRADIAAVTRVGQVDEPSTILLT